MRSRSALRDRTGSTPVSTPVGRHSTSGAPAPSTKAPPPPPASPVPPVPVADDQMTHRQILEALSGLLLALLVAILSSTIVTNALPTILAELNGTQSQYTWVVTATLLSATATTPVWGKLADLFSKKVLMQASISLFALGSILCGLATSVPMLIGFRAVQGLGLGGVQALAAVIIAAMVSPRERGRYSGYLGAVFAVGTVSGPLVGGLIVDTSWLGWRWCFFVVVPVAIAAFIVLGRTLRLPLIKRKVSIDWLGATLIVGGVCLLLVWVSFAGNAFAWTSTTSLVLLGAALLCLAGAVLVERRVSEPVVPLRLFRDRTFTLATVAGIGLGIAMFGGSLFIGQYFQLGRGHSPTAAGLLTLPLVLSLFVTSTASGWLISRWGRWKGFLTAGSISLLLGLCLLATIDHDTQLWLVGCYLALLGSGVGLSMQNLVLAVQNNTHARDLGAATATVTFFRSLGGATGVSVLGAVLSGQVAARVAAATGGAAGEAGASLDIATLPKPLQDVVHAAYGDATGLVFGISAVAAVVTLVAVLFIREVPLRTTV
ncbi:Major Facilitator Superfamily transporter [Actinoalloteichus sp. GBA129-24]|uniref:Major Facilitator Superfamily transporter n=2 Tax=Pseudonocardiaceae TaxID=2070 RepID=A0AAC9LKR3_9PSEU|nr:Major Facilitator Superfamily transporter [Actinoalloteichus fjordicus]APU23987.1 Major Facilitator Superfamily transporter [Actinoalloteichus sp. GBA129-24]